MAKQDLLANLRDELLERAISKHDERIINQLICEGWESFVEEQAALNVLRNALLEGVPDWSSNEARCLIENDWEQQVIHSQREPERIDEYHWDQPKPRGKAEDETTWVRLRGTSLHQLSPYIVEYTFEKNVYVSRIDGAEIDGRSLWEVQMYNIEPWWYRLDKKNWVHLIDVPYDFVDSSTPYIVVDDYQDMLLVARVDNKLIGDKAMFPVSHKHVEPWVFKDDPFGNKIPDGGDRNRPVRVLGFDLRIPFYIVDQDFDCPNFYMVKRADGASLPFGQEQMVVHRDQIQPWIEPMKVNELQIFFTNLLGHVVISGEWSLEAIEAAQDYFVASLRAKQGSEITADDFEWLLYFREPKKKVFIYRRGEPQEGIELPLTDSRVLLSLFDYFPSSNKNE